MLQLLTLAGCPLCKLNDRKHLFNIKHSAVYQCRICGLRYIDPCLSEEAMAGVYESNENLTKFHDFHEGYYDYGDLSKKSKTLIDFRRALSMLENHVAERSIFDVGFGNGFFLAAARERGWKVCGIDSSMKNLELTRKKFSLELTCANFDIYEPDDTKYDVVSFWDVIEHCSDPYKFIKKAAQMLKPNGFVLIGLPNDRSLLRIISAAIYQLSFGKIKSGIARTYFLEHVAYYELKTLSELMKRNRFVIRDFFYTSTDLAKYSLAAWEKLMAACILMTGCFLHLENRLVAIFQSGMGN